MQNTTKLIAGHPPKKTEEWKAAGPALGEKILNHGWSSAVLQLQLRTVISVLKKMNAHEKAFDDENKKRDVR